MGVLLCVGVSLALIAWCGLSLNDGKKKGTGLKKDTDLSSVMSRERTKDDGMRRSKENREDIMTVEQARAYEESRAFRRDTDAFRAEVRGRIECLRDCGDDERELNDFYISEYEKLLGMTIADRSGLEQAKWLYNCGDLRTSDEIYVHSGQFTRNCNKRTYGLPYGLFFMGYLLVLIPFMAKLYDPLEPGISMFVGFIGGSVLGCMLGGILGLIGGLIGESMNKSEADSMLKQGIDEATPMARRARVNLTSTVAAGTVAAYSVGKHAKKTVSDITNVDGWKQMK